MIVPATYIACAALLLLLLLSLLANPFFRLLRFDDGASGEPSADSKPALSVLLTVQGRADTLSQCMQAILAQDYKQGFEVVVVLERGDIEAGSIIKRYSGDKRVYATFIPDKSLFMSKEKLAVSIGVKACHNDWIVLTSADCVPKSKKWLSALARHCSDGCDMALGYSNYDPAAPSSYRFDQMRTSLYFMRTAQRHTAYRATEANIMFRKSLFIEGDGYRDNLQFRRGEYDFIINKYARKGSTAVDTSADASVSICPPTKKTWRNKCLSDIHLRRHLRRTWRYRMAYKTDLFLMYANYIAATGVLVYAATVRDTVLTVAAAVCLTLTVVVRTVFARNAAMKLGEQIAVWRLPLLELSLGFRGVINRLRYTKSDKTEFTTHRI